MRWTKTSSVLLIAAALVMTTACSSKQGADAGKSPKADASLAPTQADPNDGPLTKYKEPIKVTTYSVNNPNFTQNETIDDNLQTRLNLNHLNIQYVNKFVVDKEKLADKLNLAIASNDLPDVMEIDDAQTLQKLIKNGQLADLKSTYARYASPELKKMLEYDNALNFKPVTVDGKLFAIPLPSSPVNLAPVMYVRADWLKKLNLQAPKTMDELMAVAKAFVEQDPDGDGQKDTYAIAMDKTMTFPLKAIGAAYHVYPWIWQKDASGNLAYGSIQPAMKDVLGKFQELYKMGAIDPEFAVKDNTKVSQTVGSGKVGIYFGEFWQPISPLVNTMDTVKDADWDAYPIPGENVVPPNAPFANRWVVVRKGFDHPEAPIKSMNLYVIKDTIPEYTEAINTTHKDLQYHVNAKPAHFDDPNKNIIIGQQIRAAIATKSTEGLKHPEAKHIWDLIQKGGKPAWYYTKIYTQSMKIFEDNYKTFAHDEFFGVPTPSMLTKKPTLDKLESETYVKIIMGAPLSEFDDFVSKWHKLGGDDIAKEVNNWAKSNK